MAQCCTLMYCTLLYCAVFCFNVLCLPHSSAFAHYSHFSTPICIHQHHMFAIPEVSRRALTVRSE